MKEIVKLYFENSLRNTKIKQKSMFMVIGFNIIKMPAIHQLV